MKLQLIPFRASHVRTINPQVADEAMALYATAELQGRAFTACLLGDPVGCAGVWMDGKEGGVFAEFSPLIKRRPKELFKLTRDGLKEIIEELKPQALFALVDPQDATAVRFITRLGFKPGKQIYEMR